MRLADAMPSHGAATYVATGIDPLILLRDLTTHQLHGGAVIALTKIALTPITQGAASAY
jgi:hypothetical protein